MDFNSSFPLRVPLAFFVLVATLIYVFSGVAGLETLQIQSGDPLASQQRMLVGVVGFVITVAILIGPELLDGNRR
jgi:hypothetical protein